MCFSAQALSAVFTSDKLLLSVLISVLHPTIVKTATVGTHSVSAVESSARCSGASKQYCGKAGSHLSSRKSGTVSAKRNCASCNSRRLSEPLINNVEQMQTSHPWLDRNSFEIDRTRSYSSTVVEKLRLDGSVSNPFGSISSAVWLRSRLHSHGHAATAACSKQPLVVNSVYGSDDCITPKCSLEKKDLRLREHTSARNQVLHVPENTLNGSVIDQRMSPTLVLEEKHQTAASVSPAVNDSATFLEVPSAERGHFGGSADESYQVRQTNDEVHDVCSQFQYRKLCVYLQEGTWRHSPHSLHCIRIDDDISLVVLCEVNVLIAVHYLILLQLWCILH